ncbi:hypothetical protein CS022_20145 [Veronia nyctiphanis]|uniref:Uncharacterized protein n=1 Tax=Veronia nyctiphanis TaxID=1278244 RepID=A0A4V1LSG9_9GAMM|nr:AAA family ATPase [Veronia nyctiphanis]RXJ71658.1 hypothetical protein CS022_20145 [Veronia nyctiphanis]
MDAQLIVIGGLPGTGKTTLSKALSKRLELPVFSKDELEAAVSRAEIASNRQMNGVGYELMDTIAHAHIDSCRSVIFDFIASKNRIIECWPSLLSMPVKYIECICSDESRHQERILSRERGIKGWYELSWEDVAQIKAIYNPYTSERLILDTAAELDKNIKLALKYIDS